MGIQELMRVETLDTCDMQGIRIWSLGLGPHLGIPYWPNAWNKI